MDSQKKQEAVVQAQKQGTQQKKLSKNEQKRQEKAKKKLQQKQQKQEKQQKKHQKTQQQKQLLDPTLYFQNRSKLIKQLKQKPQTYPYPHKFSVLYTITQFINQYKDKTKQNQFLTEITSIAGRITNIRSSGKSLMFIDVSGDGNKLQVYYNQKQYKGQNHSQIDQSRKQLRRGDIVGVSGYPGRTKTNQLSISPISLKLLSPCLHMLPQIHVGFKNNQSRYRKRFLDLIMNKKTKDTFLMRTKVIKFVRRYLDNLGFIQVETPMMNMIPGGANARPFITYHNDLNMKLYMRIAPQLYLKQLIVGGMDRVYEIGKNFRNQSIDQTHNPQYTSCQFYMAYADFNDLMNITEDLLSKMVLELTGSYKLTYHPDYKDKQKVIQIDFTPPWRRISMMEELEKCLNQKMPQNIASQQANIFFDTQCKKHHVQCTHPRNISRLIDKLVGHFLQTQCTNPTFIIQHPQLMSPLAKYHRSKQGLTQRFQLFINQKQFCNAYTELNDPFVQRQLFQQQVKQKQKGDQQSMFFDQTFVNALQHALPPTAGWGLGIDRTVMLITDQNCIQQVLLFPAMKPIDLTKPVKEDEESQEQDQVEKKEKIKEETKQETKEEAKEETKVETKVEKKEETKEEIKEEIKEEEKKEENK